MPIHKHDVKGRLEKIKQWKVQESVRKNLERFVEDLEMGKVNKGKRISERTQIKYLTLLKCPLEFFHKPIDKLTLKDVENVEKAINSTQMKSVKDKPYSASMRVDIRVALRVFLKWKLGSTKAARLTDWLDTRGVKKTPDYLSEQDVEKLYKACRSNHERYIIAMLFDSGARAEEFHNIRYEDIQLPSGSDNYVKITLKEEYSKTEGRTVLLYWKHSFEAVKDYIRDREAEGIRSDEQVFLNTYDSVRFFLRRLGMNVLKKPIHFHLFRHSSATFYASKLNRQQLCYRYGWKFSSDMPDVYISRAGMENKDLDQKFEQTEMASVKAKVDRLEESNRSYREAYDLLLRDHAILRKDVEAFKKVLGEFRKTARRRS